MQNFVKKSPLLKEKKPLEMTIKASEKACAGPVQAVPLRKVPAYCT